jgi:prevent-host-death family protein
MCDTDVMSRRITQRELRNESGRIMRAVNKGESFTVTRNGVPVGELVPVRPRAFTEPGRGRLSRSHGHQRGWTILKPSCFAAVIILPS